MVYVSLTTMCVLLVCETDRTPTSHSLALDGPGAGKGSEKCGLEAVTQNNAEFIAYKLIAWTDVSYRNISDNL